MADKVMCLNCGHNIYFQERKDNNRWLHEYPKSHNPKCSCRIVVAPNPKTKELFTTKFDKNNIIQEYKTIQVDKILFSGKNPRKRIKNIEELAENIVENGLINPITVKPLKSGEYEIVSGERRFRALKHLNWKEIPCKVKEPSPYEMLAENLAREDMSLVEKVPAIRDVLFEKFGRNWKQIAISLGNGSNSWHDEKKEMDKVFKAIGVKPSTFVLQLPVLDLGQTAIDRILETPEYYTDGVVMKLARLRDEDSQVRITKSISDNKFRGGSSEIFRVINQASFQLKGLSEVEARWVDFEENLSRRANDLKYMLKKLNEDYPTENVRVDLKSKLFSLQEQVDLAIQNLEKSERL